MLLHLKKMPFQKNTFAGPISGITTTAECPIWAGPTTWNTFQSEISTMFLYLYMYFQAPWLPEWDPESEIQVRQGLQDDLKMTTTIKNPTSKAGNTKKACYFKKVQKNALILEFFGREFADTPKSIKCNEITFKFAKWITLAMTSLLSRDQTHFWNLFHVVGRFLFDYETSTYNGL